MRLIDADELLKGKVDNAYISRFEIEQAPAVNAIVLPCDIGDTVYVDAGTIGTNDEIEYAEAYVVSVRITKKQTLVKLRIYALNFEQSPYGCKNYPVSAFGKTVFLTSDDAEQALQKLNERNRKNDVVKIHK